MHCTLSGHPLSVTDLVLSNGTYWPTATRCHCGTKSTAKYPGKAFKEWYEHYERLPTEWPEIYTDTN